MPYIIPLNTKGDDKFSPRGAPISDYELSVDYSMGKPTSESEADLNASPNFSDEAVSTPPDSVLNIYP